MKNSTILSELSRDEVMAFFNELKSKIENLEQNFQPVQPSKFLTRTEVRDMLQINMATLHNWCKAGKLNPMGIGNRVYFLRSELEAAIKPIR